MNVRRSHLKRAKNEKGKKGARPTNVSKIRETETAKQIIQQGSNEKISSLVISSGKTKMNAVGERQLDGSNPGNRLAIAKEVSKKVTTRYPFNHGDCDADSLWIDYDGGGLLDGWSDADSFDYRMNSGELEARSTNSVVGLINMR